MSNATLSRIINKNEEDANKAAANVMLITFVIFTAVYILNLVDVFVIDEPDMTIAYCLSAVFLLLPKLLNRLVPLSAKWLKYLYITLSELFLMVITTALSYHVVVVYAYPIVLAGLYFSKRLTNISTVCTLAVTIAETLAAAGGRAKAADASSSPPNARQPTIFLVICMVLKNFIEIPPRVFTSSIFHGWKKDEQEKGHLSRCPPFFVSHIQNPVDFRSGMPPGIYVYDRLLLLSMRWQNARVSHCQLR